MRRSWLIFLLILVLVACGHREPEKAKVSPRQIEAETLVVSPTEVTLVREFSGVVRARNQLRLSPKVSGYVERVFVEEGQEVSPGAPLLHIDDREIRERLKALSAALAAVKKEKEAVSARRRYAASNYERFKKLYAEEAATKEEFERVEAEYRALLAQEKALHSRAKEIEARIQETKAILPYTLLKSPTKAVVVARLADRGSFVAAGQPVVVLDDLTSGFQFLVSLDEKFLPKVQPGQEYWVFFPSLLRGEWARVAEVVRQVDPATRTFRIKLDLSETGLHSGLYGRLAFPVAKRKALLIPWRAVALRGDLTGVMVVEPGNIIRFRVVRLGRSFTEVKGRFVPTKAPAEYALARETTLWVEVLSGLSPGERIVSSNLEKVRDGDQIK